MLRKAAAVWLATAAGCLAAVAATPPDTVPAGVSRPVGWRIGTELSSAWVPGTCTFLRGANPAGRRVVAGFGGSLRADFSFDSRTREGRLYRGLYQGIGVGADGFVDGATLGTPVSLYIYQGAPIVRISPRLWLGYEWQFGAAMGWKHYPSQAPDNNAAVSTAVTARLGLGLRLHYRPAPRWQLLAGLQAVHFSNGNTHWPNGGVNALGVVLGVAYDLHPHDAGAPSPSPRLEAEADRGRWLYDIMVYGAWRKRIVTVGGEQTLCPGRFGVAGLQFAPARRLNRFVAVGPALDVQWDESAGLAPYWIEGTAGDAIRFIRPPFHRQLSVGVSAHAELTMPIFAVNAGLGYGIVSPRGDRRFYQTLTLKTFVTSRLYLNVGYRLGAFKDPQNLMLGAGIRL